MTLSSSAENTAITRDSSSMPRGCALTRLADQIAETLEVSITSLRLGGIVGHHEVIFGFPHQTMCLIHESIRREAFGTGAAFALEQLTGYDNGFYTFDDLLLRMMRNELLD